VVDPDATGNAYLQNWIYYGAAGAAFNAHSAIVGPAAVALTNTLISEVQSVTSFPSLGTDDYLGLWLHRDATNVADTINSGMSVIGWVFEYISDS